MSNATKLNENRNFQASVSIEKRASGENSRNVKIIAAVFSSLSKTIGGGFKERIEPKAFDNADMSDVVCVLNHDFNILYARTSSKTLKLEIDSKGLIASFQAPNTGPGNDLLTMIERGDIRQASFQFIVNKDRWIMDPILGEIRIIESIKKVIDVSPVVFPAYENTDVAIRSKPTVLPPIPISDVAIRSKTDVQSTIPAVVPDSQKDVEHRQDNQTSTLNIKKMKTQNYSLLRAIRQAQVSNRLSGFEKEIADEGESQLRGNRFDTKGSIFIPSKYLGKSINKPFEKREVDLAGSNVPDFVSVLNEQSVLTKLGAQILPGIITGYNNGLQFPVPGTAQAKWEEEIRDADTFTVTQSPVFKPKALISTAKISKTLLLMDGSDVIEMFVAQEIARSMDQALQRASIKATISGDAVGILNNSGISSVSLADNGRALNQSDILALVKEVSLNSLEMGSCGFLTNPYVRDRLKKAPLDAGSGEMIWNFNSDKLASYNAGISNGVPADLTKGTGEGLSALIFGNFSDLLLIQFNAIDILVDHVSSARSNFIELVITSYWHAQVLRPKSFAAITDIVTG